MEDVGEEVAHAREHGRRTLDARAERRDRAHEGPENRVAGPSARVLARARAAILLHSAGIRDGPNEGLQAAARGRSSRSSRACARWSLALALSGGAGAQDLQSELDSKEAQLSEEKEEKAVLSTEISAYSDKIDVLAGQVAVLRNREAIVQAELDEVKARLRSEKEKLEALQQHLRRSLNALRDRLVSIYRSEDPDVLTVILTSDGFDDLVNRYEYLRRIEERDATIVGRVRFLRNGTRETVDRVEADRDEIAAKKAELVRTRSQLEAREGELDAARDEKAAALDQVEGQIERARGRHRRHPGQDPGADPGRLGGADDAAARRPDPGRRGRRHDLARQRAGHLAVRPALGPDARGHRHRDPRRHADPRRAVGERDPRRLHERLRQLHLHRPRRRALDLLRPPVELRDERRRRASTRAR